MILLSKAEEILLMQFHEVKGDRTGAKAGEALPEDAFRDAERTSPGIEFDGSLEGLVHKGLVQGGENGSYTLTETGYEYLYAGAGHRTGEN